MLLYKYIYEFNGGEYIFYAPSQDEADIQYKELFNVDVIKFLRREPW